MPARYPERIVCLTEETTETLYLLGEERRIVGISGYTVRPPRARREKPRVSAFLSAKIDKILALRPDLVIGFSDLQADIARDLARAGLNVLLFNQRSVDEILSMILTLASLVGASAKGERLVAELEAGLAAYPRRGGALRAPAARLLRGMGRADDQRHRLGERAGRHRRRRGHLPGARAQPRGRRAHRHRSAGGGARAARRDPRLVVREEVPARARRRAARLGRTCPRCATASCTRSSPPTSCSPGRQRSPTACGACTRFSAAGRRARRNDRARRGVLGEIDRERREDGDAAVVRSHGAGRHKKTST